MVKATNQNERFILKFLKTLSTGNLDRVRPMFHDEATWEVMSKGIPGEGTHRGKKGIIDDFLAPVRGLFEPGDPKVEVKTIISKGPIVVTETRGRGKLKNGKDYDNLYVWVYEIKHGKVYRLREYMDSHYIAGLAL
jgi:hypothetical protein